MLAAASRESLGEQDDPDLKEGALAAAHWLVVFRVHNPMDTTIREYAELDDGLLQILEDLDRPTFSEPLTKATFAAELRGRRNLRVLLAVRGDTMCGYKIGFEESSKVFFSWSGGVLPPFVSRALPPGS